MLFFFLILRHFLEEGVECRREGFDMFTNVKSRREGFDMFRAIATSTKFVMERGAIFSE